MLCRFRSRSSSGSDVVGVEGGSGPCGGVGGDFGVVGGAGGKVEVLAHEGGVGGGGAGGARGGAAHVFGGGGRLGEDEWMGDWNFETAWMGVGKARSVGGRCERRLVDMSAEK